MVDFQSRDTRRTDERENGADDGDTDEHAHDGSEHHGDEHGHDEHDGNGHAHDGHDGHDHGAHDVETVAFGVVTVSTSRGEGDDPSGDAIASLVEEAGHEVVAREYVADDFDDVQGTVDRLVRRDGVAAVVTTGGTGVTPDDVTVEAVRPLCEKRLPGFGELFRRLSYDEIGTRVVGTRAEAGVAGGVPVFCLPGSESAVRLGVAEVILPEVSHLVGLAKRDDEDGETDDGPGVSPDEAEADDDAEGTPDDASGSSREDRE